MFIMINIIDLSIGETITQEQVDDNIKNILLMTVHEGDSLPYENIKSLQVKLKLKDEEILNSLYGILNTREKNKWLNEQIIASTIYSLEFLGNHESLLKISSFIDKEKPLSYVSRYALDACIVLSDYELKKVEEYIEICVSEKKTSLFRPLIEKLLLAYSDAKTSGQKKHLETVIKQTIKLLDKNNDSYWIKEKLDKEKLGWMLNGLTLVNQGNDPRKKKKIGNFPQKIDLNNMKQNDNAKELNKPFIEKQNQEGNSSFNQKNNEFVRSKPNNYVSKTLLLLLGIISALFTVMYFRKKK